MQQGKEGSELDTTINESAVFENNIQVLVAYSIYLNEWSLALKFILNNIQVVKPYQYSS
jgi:hypothetical protein